MILSKCLFIKQDLKEEIYKEFKKSKVKFGKKRFYEKGDKVFVEYFYGAEDYSKMLLDTPLNQIEQAIKECKQNKKNTFGDLINNEDFFIKHFDRARELSEERKNELEIYKQRTRGYTR